MYICVFCAFNHHESHEISEVFPNFISHSQSNRKHFDIESKFKMACECGMNRCRQIETYMWKEWLQIEYPIESTKGN